jgi:hypothetical protein
VRISDMAMIKRLMRFRVLKEPLVVGGISLPKGDYDGEISWSELPFMHHQNRVHGPSRIAVTRAVLQATEQPMPDGILSIDIDASTAVKRGDVVAL